MTQRAATHGAGRDVLNKALTEHKAFQTSGALRGEEWERDTVSLWDLGELPRGENGIDWTSAFMMDHLAGIAYVVWSYQTPIAWVRKDGKITRPNVRYSRTTSKHQGTLYLLGE